MKNILIICILSLLLLMVISCDENCSGINYGTIEGTVFDGETNETISGVEIGSTPVSAVVRSNDKGIYQLRDLMPGQYTLRASKSGYKIKFVIVTVQSGKVTRADIMLEKGTGVSDDDIGDNDDDNEEPVGNLIAHYKFDNNLDCSINSVSNMQGIGISYVQNKKGEAASAILFNGTGSSYAFTDEKNTFNLNEFTYSCWLKPNTGFGRAYSGYIDFVSRWGHWGASNQSFALSLSTDGRVKGYLYEMNSSQVSHSSNYTIYETSKRIDADVWSHIAMTYVNRKLKIYINTELVLDMASVHPQSSSLYGLTIGKRPDNNQQSYYSGAMDDLRIYNKALTQEEIKKIFDLLN